MYRTVHAGKNLYWEVSISDEHQQIQELHWCSYRIRVARPFKMAQHPSRLVGSVAEAIIHKFGSQRDRLLSGVAFSTLG